MAARQRGGDCSPLRRLPGSTRLWGAERSARAAAPRRAGRSLGEPGRARRERRRVGRVGKEAGARPWEAGRCRRRGRSGDGHHGEADEGLRVAALLPAAAGAGRGVAAETVSERHGARGLLGASAFSSPGGWVAAGAGRGSGCCRGRVWRCCPFAEAVQEAAGF